MRSRWLRPVHGRRWRLPGASTVENMPKPPPDHGEIAAVCASRCWLTATATSRSAGIQQAAVVIRRPGKERIAGAVFPVS